MLAELSVAEVVVRSLHVVGSAPDNLEGRELLLQDLRGLLGAIAVKALMSHHHMQVIFIYLSFTWC